MTDAQLEAKFTELSAPVIGADKTKTLIAAAWNDRQMPTMCAQ